MKQYVSFLKRLFTIESWGGVLYQPYVPPGTKRIERKVGSSGKYKKVVASVIRGEAVKF